MSAASPLTEHQRQAIELRDVSIALAAGAGCGKTYVLTRRFLSHLQPGPDCAELSRLVAITFTDRAAREMRDRIRAECRRQLRSCSPEHVSHWLAILYGLDTARITTIHSFCASLLRSNAVQAGLDPRFTVEDAAQTEALVQRSARDSLHRLLSRQQPDAMTLVLHFGLERSREILAETIRQRFRAAIDRLSMITQAECAAEWPRLWQEIYVPDVVNEFRSSAQCDAVRTWLAEHAPKKTSPLWERCRIVHSLLENAIPAGSDPVAWLTELREAAKVQGGHKTHWDDPEDHAELSQLWKDLREDADRCVKKIQFEPADIDFAAELTERTSRLAAIAIADYEALKQQQGQLDFDDLLLKTRDLLRTSPQVARKLAEGIQLLMVDEFQDTDQVQAEIIRAIAGAALTSGKLFLVGDAQQSIYRFRRADPDVFRALREKIPEPGRLPLTTNFRSVPDVLNFVNHVFRRALGADFQALAPSEPHQVSQPERAAVGPAIEFLWATSDVVPAKSAAKKLSVDDLRRREAEWMALRIAQLIQDPKPVIRDKSAVGKVSLRPVQPGDIVILFRALSDVDLYEAALAEKGIEYYLVGGKSFYAQQEVFDLLNLCKWLDDPADEIPLVGVLRSPFFNLADDGIHALKSSGEPLAKALEQPPPPWLQEHDQQRIRFAAGVLRELRTLKDRLPPSELLQAAIERTGYDAALLHEYLGERKVANLDKLIRQAAEFDDAEQFTLSDYVRQLERSVQDQTEESLAATLPEAGNVVRLMTIHQSKGLEFPVVFIADLNRQGNPRTGSVVMHREWGVLIRPPEEFEQSREHLGLRIYQREEEPADAEELQRLLYVATTRAADRLILSAGLTSIDDAKSPWLQLLGERFDLQTGLPKGDPWLGSNPEGGAGRDTIPDILVHRQPPPVSHVKSASVHLIPLSKLVEELSAAEVAAFPETTRQFPPADDWLGTISVSRLESLITEHPVAREYSGEDLEHDGPHVAADQLGTLVHHVMQRIEFDHLDQWEAVLAECVRRLALPAGDVPELVRQAGTMIQRLIASPFAGELKSAAQVHREIDFVLHWPLGTAKPRAVLTGQIDVLLQDSHGNWQLWDYKTGQFPRSSPDAELLAPYELQLGIYALAAEQFLGRPLESIGLVALRPQVRLLKWGWNASRQQALSAQIDALLRANHSAASARAD